MIFFSGPIDDGVGPVGPDPAGRGNIGDAGFADGHDAVGPFHHFTGPYGKADTKVSILEELFWLTNGLAYRFHFASVMLDLPTYFPLCSEYQTNLKAIFQAEIIPSGYTVLGYGAKSKDSIGYTLLWSKVCSHKVEMSKCLFKDGPQF